MTLQLSVSCRNAMLDSLEATIGVSPVLEIRSGSAPANCAAADSGTLLASLSLPSDFMAAAASGSKAMSGSWADSSADASGTAAHFRLKSSGGTVHAQGTVGTSGTDMIVDSTSFTAGQGFTISSFAVTAGNA